MDLHCQLTSGNNISCTCCVVSFVWKFSCYRTPNWGRENFGFEGDTDGI